MTPKRLPKQIRQFAVLTIGGLLVFSFFLSFSASAVSAYTEPLTNPPQYDTAVVPEIINVSGSATVYQQKTGNLLVGPTDSTKCGIAVPNGTNDNSGCAKFCLNPMMAVGFYTDTSDTTGSPPNCITSWADLAVDTSGFLKLFESTGTLPPFTNGSSPNMPEAGYIAWQAKPSGTSYDDIQAGQPYNNNAQLFSFIAEAPAETSPPYSGTIPPAAIRAEGDASNYYAGQFLGTLGVVGWGGAQPRLCLNDQDSGGGSCISRWSDLAAFSDLQIVPLQDLRAPQHFLSQGHTAASGTLYVQSLVAGEPLLTTPVGYSCGDGICNGGEYSESINYCPADCN